MRSKLRIFVTRSENKMEAYRDRIVPCAYPQARGSGEEIRPFAAFFPELERHCLVDA